MRLIPHLGDTVTKTYPEAAVADVEDRIDAFVANLTLTEQLAVGAVFRVKGEQIEQTAQEKAATLEEALPASLRATMGIISGKFADGEDAADRLLEPSPQE